MEYKGIVLAEGMILAGPQAAAEAEEKPAKGGKGAKAKGGEREAYKIIRIHEPELVQREVHGGYDHTVELEPGQKPEITGIERKYTKAPLMIDFQEFRFGSHEERERFKSVAKNFLLSHKEFDKWAKDKKLEVVLDEYGAPVVDNRDMKAEYAEIRKRRMA